MKKSIIGTSCAMGRKFKGENEAEISPFLKRLLEENVDVWVVSTRADIDSDLDRIWRKFIPDNRILYGEPAQRLYEKVFKKIGLELPEGWWDVPTNNTWLDMRAWASKQGVITRPIDLRRYFGE